MKHVEKIIRMGTNHIKVKRDSYQMLTTPTKEKNSKSNLSFHALRLLSSIKEIDAF